MQPLPKQLYVGFPHAKSAVLRHVLDLIPCATAYTLEAFVQIPLLLPYSSSSLRTGSKTDAIYITTMLMV